MIDTGVGTYAHSLISVVSLVPRKSDKVYFVKLSNLSR